MATSQIPGLSLFIKDMSLAATGFVKFRGGLMLQWVTLAGQSYTPTAWESGSYQNYPMGNWPQAFASLYVSWASTTVPQLFCALIGCTASSAGTVRAYSLSKTWTGSNLKLMLVGIGRWA